jgi:hypothetical protein
LDFVVAHYYVSANGAANGASPRRSDSPFS